jgi:hypothetical protein
MLGRWYVRRVDRDDARRLATALRDQLWSSATDELLQRLSDRGGMNVGLNPPDEVEDEELVELVWRAAQTAGLADPS